MGRRLRGKGCPLWVAVWDGAIAALLIAYVGGHVWALMGWG